MGADNIKNLRSRIRSIGNAQKIARAMFISASVRYRRATEYVDGGRCSFFMARSALALLTPHIRVRNSRGRNCIIVIGGDRGMSGGYNGAVLKEAMLCGREDSVFLPVGRRIGARLSAAGREIVEGEWLSSEKPDEGQLRAYMKQVADAVFGGELSSISIIYTDSEGRMHSSVRRDCLFPAAADIDEVRRMIFEPEPEEFARGAFAEILFCAVRGALYTANVCEEQARRMAMDGAQKNARNMLDEMTGRLNRIRQAGITQEIVETVSGVSAESR